METQIAYFCAEFGMDSALPIYSGGLGVLAGDHMKAAGDLGISLTGVGIFYKKGYFQQRIQANGMQEACYPSLHPQELPVTLALDGEGRPVIIEVWIGNRPVYLQIWKVQAGRVPVYLLDADLERNQPADRELTAQLYGGNQDTRICQEIILGIGGVRALRALRVKPDVWHLNEGHSAFSSLERIRELSAQGIDFATALEAVKAGTVFTTHTPVPAGHDRFSIEMIDRYLGHYYWQLGTTREDILSLGMIDGHFNMTRLAVTTSAKVNGVSKLHAKVTREMFHAWKPDIPAEHIPVDAITNGIHTPTWLGSEMKELFDRYLDSSWRSRIADRKVWERVYDIPDEEVWTAHQQAKRRMIRDLGLPLSEQVLTVGFARRFATYKRPLLVFHDLERLEKIVRHEQHPVVFVYAGKAHPADQPGQEMIRRIFELANSDSLRGRFFLLENYDMNMAKSLVSGVDVWLNTPQKPMEASGTSGQKAAVNGVLNLSVLDGWWNEGYNGANGWAIEGGHDQSDSEAIYRLLEEQIAPLYYENRPRWIQMVKESIRSITPVFSTSCMVAEYWGKLYIPTAIRGQRFYENDYEVARRVAAFKRFIRENWHHVRVEAVDIIPAFHSAAKIKIHATIRLGSVWHKDIRVQAVGTDQQGGLWKQELQLVRETGQGVYLYAGSYPGTVEQWQQANANVRVIPVSPDFASDFELELVRWG